MRDGRKKDNGVLESLQAVALGLGGRGAQGQSKQRGDMIWKEAPTGEWDQAVGDKDGSWGTSKEAWDKMGVQKWAECWLTSSGKREREKS